MERAPTVRIVYPANKRCGYCQIPEAKFDPRIHTRWEDRDAEPELVAVHRGRGSYSIMRGAEELADGLTKADADQFNALSAADKAAFVAGEPSP